MSRRSNTRMKARALTSCVAPVVARGLGGIALTAAFLVPAATAFAVSDDDQPASRTEVIGVTIPEHSGAPTTPTPTPSPTRTATPTTPTTSTPAPGSGHGGASGELPDTGADSSAFWPIALSALGTTAAGAIMLAARRRRHPRV